MQQTQFASQILREAEEHPQYHASFLRDGWRRLVRNRLALCGLAGVGVLLFIALFANLLMTHPFARIYYGNAELGPSHRFLLGTDIEGRDTFSRFIYGDRVSMFVGLATAAIIATLGVGVGAIAGLYGGFLDAVLMRLVDIVYAVPSLLLAMLLMSSLGRGVWQLCLAIGVVSWPTMARLVRGQFLSLREQDYVKAARVAGTGDFSMIARHLLPNALTPVVVALTFAIPGAIFAEAALSFLGIGINPPTPSWGQMVAQSQAYFGSDPWLVLTPVFGVAFALLAFTFLGDGLRDALDPFMNE